MDPRQDRELQHGAEVDRTPDAAEEHPAVALLRALEWSQDGRCPACDRSSREPWAVKRKTVSVVQRISHDYLQWMLECGHKVLSLDGCGCGYGSEVSCFQCGGPKGEHADDCKLAAILAGR